MIDFDFKAFSFRRQLGIDYSIIKIFLIVS